MYYIERKQDGAQPCEERAKYIWSDDHPRGVDATVPSGVLIIPQRKQITPVEGETEKDACNDRDDEHNTERGRDREVISQGYAARCERPEPIEILAETDASILRNKSRQSPINKQSA